MEPRSIAKKCDVQNIFSISGKEDSQPSAVLHKLEVVTFLFHAPMLPCTDAGAVFSNTLLNKTDDSLLRTVT
jgi:hypothetical protein